jgi:predicted DNA binding protein
MMSTIAEFRVPTAETTLAVALDALPGTTIELESAVSRTRPCLWVAGVDPATATAAFEEDPSVESFDLLVETDDRLLYDVVFVDDAELLTDRLVVEGGSLLEARATNGWWQAKVRYQDRDALCRAHDRLVEQGISVDLRRVTDVTTSVSTSSQLTSQQEEAIEAALERGYFEIPRDISMEELAAELGISHQALSERLRRAYETLVYEELQPVSES